MWNFGNLGIGDSAPVTLGQLVALMAVMVMKVLCNTHTHPFNCPLSGTTRVSRYQKVKTNLQEFTNYFELVGQPNCANADLGYCQEVKKLLSDGTSLSGT